LGEGNTSKVYLGRSLQNANSLVAIKIMRDEFLQRDENSLRAVENEITILKNMKHQGIVQMLDYGDNGQVLKPSGRVIPSLIYIVMEYVEGGLLFDLCQLMQAMGEDSGRFFAHQMLNSIEYLHSIRVVHRDLKLENLLVDSHLNLKVADFGFASYKNIDCLKSYRGTMTYMAPEIKEGKPYKGAQVDLFSFGVILFILVHGIFPFKEARTEEYFYNLIVTGQTDLYFQKVNGSELSAEFKDLILSLFAYQPEQRLTIDQIRQHPWLNRPGFNFEATRTKMLHEITSRQMEL
jgi:serine/threonine protein kinase